MLYGRLQLFDGKYTPLHYPLACNNNHIDIIKFLVENKSDLNLANDFNSNPLHLACENKSVVSLDIVKYLVENKVELNSKNDDNYTPLHSACENTKISIEIVKFLIKNKSDLNLKNGKDETPLVDSQKHQVGQQF